LSVVDAKEDFVVTNDVFFFSLLFVDFYGPMEIIQKNWTTYKQNMLRTKCPFQMSRQALLYIYAVEAIVPSWWGYAWEWVHCAKC